METKANYGTGWDNRLWLAGQKTIQPVRAPGETPAPATIGLGAPPARVYAPPAANPYAPTGAPAGPTSVSGIDTQSPAGPNLAQQLRDQWGGNWNISGVDRADELARVLQSRGVTDLSNMKLGTDRQYADPNWSPNSWMNSEGWTPPDPNAPPETARALIFLPQQPGRRIRIDAAITEYGVR